MQCLDLLPKDLLAALFVVLYNTKQNHCPCPEELIETFFLTLSAGLRVICKRTSTQVTADCQVLLHSVL